MIKPIESILFDMDGVLVDSEPFMARAGAKALYDLFEIPARPEELKDLLYNHDRRI